MDTSTLVSSMLTATATAIMPTTTMDHGGHGGHGSHGGHGDHGGHGQTNQCKISMLWNWNTIDACFISSSWHISSRGMFAGSCIGVILLVMSLEFLRRLAVEYDRSIAGRSRLFSRSRAPQHLLNVAAAKASGASVAARAGPASPPSEPHHQHPPPPTCAAAGPRRTRPTLLQHLVRSLLHMLQFAVAYFCMLLAMYYNGYIIICIFIGSFLGYFVFSWHSMEQNDACAVTVCCG